MLFHAYNSQTIDEAFKLLTMIIQGVTGDSTLRFHHCRQSFCNWTLVRLVMDKNSQSEGFPFLQHQYFNPEQIQPLLNRLGLASFSRKKLWAVSDLLGHASPTTTISSYFHLTDFLRRNSFANHKAPSWVLRRLWERPDQQGLHITTDTFGRIKHSHAINELLQTKPLGQLKIETNSISFDVNQIMTKQAQSTNVPITLDLIFRILLHHSESQTPTQIAQEFMIYEHVVKQVVDIDQKQTQLLAKKSKGSQQDNGGLTPNESERLYWNNSKTVANFT